MKRNREWLRTGAEFMLLALIQEQDRYGYEIIKELEARSENTFEMKEGTLYPILHRMEASGYLKSYMAKGDNEKKRKYYRITTAGQKQLEEERAIWEQFSNSVKRVVNAPQTITST
ncbi:helix-turn-helix transcriptional regulator [Erysipelothrix sp. HDW6B]|uniref:PadR family transcriptional regulator n=1 Tax=Erysipelothrix TaxID=1647 RepID=UPI00135CD711|nr:MULTISPECIES: PadR family transcriptional regulator [Erysipelothrix]QIK86914.1 helix-turn-helix transcriptional regulator [Erysipelothrix sp. HDW6B]